MSKRSHISLKEKLASALAQMLQDDGTGKLVPIIPYEDRKKMTADQVISLFHFHHNILHTHDGPDAHWNIEPKLIAPHRRETAERDNPAARKVTRISDAQEEFRRRLLAREPGQARPRSGKIPSRPFPKRAPRSRHASL